MSKVIKITSRLDTIFKQIATLSNEDYNKVVFNIELLKKKYFKSKFKDKTTLYESKTFKDLIEVI